MKKSELKKEKLNSKRNGQGLGHSDSENEEHVKQEHDEVKDEVKLENGDEPKKWFEDSNAELDDEKKWDYLEHHGVTFPDYYTPKGLSIKYENVSIKLNPYQEELSWYWCQTLGTEWEESEIYRKNFSQQFLEALAKDRPEVKLFNKIDFTQIKNCLAKQKEERNNISEEKKLEKKLFKEDEAKFYGYAIVDGILEKVNGYVIEPPTLFKGRGAHPKAGLIKPRIMPEQICLNLAEDAPIPACKVPGHSWGDVVCKRDSTWLCSYKNDSISSGNAHKYIFLAANSKFKGIKDRKKYEKARSLKNNIERIREGYMKMIVDKDVRRKQLGTTTYIIDKLALRVGNEKGEDEADTVGCCSLRVEHIKTSPGNKIEFDFLGKDSMRYHNEVTVIPEVWSNIELFRRNKQPTEDLFDKIDAQALNDYLKELMPELTAKVFRTYNASSTLQNELNKCDLKGLTMDEKYDRYEEANKQVAILCNHQKTVSKKVLETLSKKERYIQILKDNLALLEKHKSKFSAKKDVINQKDLEIDFEGKAVVQKFPTTKDKTQTEIKKLKDKIEKEEKLHRKKQEGKEIALGTSKTNYNDPRISVAWCKKNEVKIEKVFTKNLQSKFLWAMYTAPEWEF